MSASLPDPALRQPPTFALTGDDATFIAQLPQIEAYLLANFPGMRGLRQHRPHFDPARDRTTDPIEHTLEVLAALDTSALDPRDRIILRAAVVFHDIGKLLDPLNIRHAIDSALICPPYLPDFGLDPDASADIIAIVRDHDVLGRIAQGRLDPASGAATFGTRRRAALTEQLTRTDISVIRGLTGVLPNIAIAYRAVQVAFDAIDHLAQLGTFTPRATIHFALKGKNALTSQQLALLDAVSSTGSLTKAATQLTLSPATARQHLRHAEQTLGLPLLTTQRGGKAGGHTTLTPEARELLRRWRTLTNDLTAWLAEHTNER